MENELSTDQEKAQELANIINMIKMPLLNVDLSYAKQAAIDMHNRASFLDSAAVLNPLYNPLKSDIMRRQAKSLTLLIGFIEELHEIQKMKDQLTQEQAAQQDVMKLFM